MSCVKNKTEKRYPSHRRGKKHGKKPGFSPSPTDGLCLAFRQAAQLLALGGLRPLASPVFEAPRLVAALGAPQTEAWVSYALLHPLCCGLKSISFLQTHLVKKRSVGKQS